MDMFLGMRGTGDWVTDQRPKNWRQQLLKMSPNGKTPLTGILSMMGEESVDDPEFNWWTEEINCVSGAVTGVYTNVGLSSAYVSGGVLGQALYVKMAEALADQIRTGHQVLLRDASDPTVDVNVKVEEVVKNGASSYIAVRLLEADDNSSAGDLSDCDRLMVIGNINPEGGEMPDAIAINPTKHYNYTQIFRTSLSITRTARKTKLRTPEEYQKLKSEALEMHGIEMEQAFWWGIRTERTGDNGKPERTTSGFVPWMKTNAATNVFNYATDVTYATDPWTTSGEEWLNNKLEVVFRYGEAEKLAICGSGALLGINRLAKAGAQIQLQPGAGAYGIKVMTWITPFGVIHLKTHPLFSYEATTQNMMVVLEPKNLKYRYFDDTSFYGEKEKQNTGRGRIDGTDEEWLTECGLEFHHPQTGGIFYNVGVNSAIATTTP